MGTAVGRKTAPRKFNLPAKTSDGEACQGQSGDDNDKQTNSAIADGRNSLTIISVHGQTPSEFTHYGAEPIQAPAVCYRLQPSV